MLGVFMILVFFFCFGVCVLLGTEPEPYGCQTSTLPLGYKTSPSFVNVSLDLISELTQKPSTKTDKQAFDLWAVFFLFLSLIICSSPFPHKERSFILFWLIV